MPILTSTSTFEHAKKVVNILPKICNFDTNIIWNTISGGENSNVESNTFYPYYGKRGVLITALDTGTHRFSIGSDAMDTLIERDGSFKLSWALLSEDPDAVIEFNIEVYRSVGGGSAVLFETLQCELNSTTTFGYVAEQYNRFFQDLNGLNEDDVLSYIFSVTFDTVGARLFFDAFMLEENNKCQIYPSIYTPVFIKPMLWQSRVDTTNTQSLTLATENLYGFTGTSESNDAVTLITTAGLIQPTAINNVVTIDYSFVLTTPAGSDKYLYVSLVVDGVTYRANTHLLIRGSGNPDPISGSFTLPVATAFFENGAEIYLNPNATCGINNRYISVVEHINIDS